MSVLRVIGTAVLGMLFLFFVAVDLLAFGVIGLNSALITVLTIGGLVLGGVVGALASRRARAGSPPLGSGGN
jgi:hypothetical protein